MKSPSMRLPQDNPDTKPPPQGIKKRKACEASRSNESLKMSGMLKDQLRRDRRLRWLSNPYARRPGL